MLYHQSGRSITLKNLYTTTARLLAGCAGSLVFADWRSLGPIQRHVQASECLTQLKSRGHHNTVFWETREGRSAGVLGSNSHSLRNEHAMHAHPVSVSFMTDI